MRKAGQAMPIEELQAKPTSEIINRILKFIRCDFGGAKGDAKARIVLKRAAEENDDFRKLLGKLSAEEQLTVASALIISAVDACESSRTRLRTTVDELRRRLLTPEDIKQATDEEEAIVRKDDSLWLNLKI